MKQRVIHEIIFAKQLCFLSLLNYCEQEVAFHWEFWHTVLVSSTVSFLSLAGEINKKGGGAVAKSSSFFPSATAPIPLKAEKCLDSLLSFWNSEDRVFLLLVFNVGVKFDGNKCFSASNLAAFISFGLSANLSLQTFFIFTMSSCGMIHISVKALAATLFQQRLTLWAGGFSAIPYFLGGSFG